MHSDNNSPLTSPSHSWVYIKLQELLQLQDTKCSSLMKRLKLILSKYSTDKIIIYDVQDNYAALFLTDKENTLYFYKNLTCSLLRPPSSSYRFSSISSLVNIKNNLNLTPTQHLNLISIFNHINQINHEERYTSDKDLLELKHFYKSKSETEINNNIDELPTIIPKTIFVSIVDVDDVEDVENVEDEDTKSTVSTISSHSNLSIHSNTNSSVSNKSTNTTKSKPPPLVKQTSKKPIPLELRPKWKR